MPKFKSFHDPDLLRAEVDTTQKRKPYLRMALGLDLATSTGVACTWFDPRQPAWDPGAYPVFMGQWDLSSGPYESGMTRFVKLKAFLGVVDPNVVFFEDIKYNPPEEPNKFNVRAIVARSALTMEFYGALKTVVGLHCVERGIASFPIAIQHIKKRATGRGNANKEQVIVACNEFFGVNLDVEGYEVTGTDNIADAAWCLVTGLETYYKGVNLGQEDPDGGKKG
jgi:hypothetical protein